MALKAFLDKAQTIEVTATDITDREHTYYCITKGCNAQMTLCAVNSKYKPYFRLKSKDIPHLDGCSDIPNDFIHTEYNIHNTQIIDILDCLSTNNDKHNSINTIKQHSIGDGRDKTATSLSTIYRLLRLTNIK